MSSTPDEPTPVEPEEAPAEAQQSPQEPETLSAMARIKRSFLQPSRSQAVVGVLLAVLGYAAVTQVRSNDVDTTYEGRRQEDLIEIFNGLTGTSDRARRDIAQLEQTRRDLQVDTSARRTAIEQAERRLETLNVLAGLVPVTGPGLRITVTENSDRVSVDSLLDMVQELRTAGAEAMEFNRSVRLVASSSFSVVDDVIHLDGQPLRSPYVLKVVGDASTLHSGLTFPSGPVSNLRNKEGAEVAIEELESVDIETVRELPRAEFAEPAEGQ